MADSEQRKDFALITNPFITGNPVRGTKVFFGREDDFAYARQRLETEKQGVVLLFGGERRSGKTSILFQILDGRLGEEFLPVFIDMQAIAGVSDDREFFTNMARYTCERVQDERIVPEYYDFTQGSPTLTFDRLLDDIRQIYPNRRLVLLIDEADLLRQKIQKGELTGSLLMYMANILENRRVSFFFTGSRGLGQSTGEQWRRLIGKATLRNISFLSRNDTVRLIAEPVEGTVKYEEGVEDGIYRSTFGHPYYTQYICSHLVDYLNGVQKDVVTLDDIGAVTDTIIDNPPPNMIYAWDELPRQEQITLSLLSEESGQQRSFVTAERLVESIGENRYPLDLQADSLHILLENLSEREVLERDSSGAYRLRVDLFRQWISRSRSVWRLMEDVQPRKPGWRLVTGIAAAVMIVGGAAVLLLREPSNEGGSRAREGSFGTPGPTTASVAIDCDVTDSVDVFIDGNKRWESKIPSVIQDVPSGRHIVGVKRPGYQLKEDTLEIVAGRPSRIQANGASLVRLHGRLSVQSSPPGADISVRGKAGTLTESVTPLTLRTPLSDQELPTGTYELGVSKTGFVPKSLTVSIREYDGAKPLQVSLVADVGALSVKSDPPGATIFLDGIAQNRVTPAELDSVEAGNRKLRLQLNAYQDHDTIVSVNRGRPTLVSFRLALLPATVALASAPSDAAVYVDDRPYDRTPQTIPLPPGKHRIRIALEGYDEEEWEQELSPGQRVTKSLLLVQQKGWVRITGIIEGTVTIDDAEDRRIPPVDIELPVGPHSIKIKGQSDSVPFQVRKGAREPVKLVKQ